MNSTHVLTLRRLTDFPQDETLPMTRLKDAARNKRKSGE